MSDELDRRIDPRDSDVVPHVPRAEPRDREGHELSANEREYVVGVILRWIERELVAETGTARPRA